MEGFVHEVNQEAEMAGSDQGQYVPKDLSPVTYFSTHPHITQLSQTLQIIQLGTKPSKNEPLGTVQIQAMTPGYSYRPVQCK